MGRWIITIVILIGLLIFSLPYLAGIPPFKQLTLYVIKKYIQADVQVESMRLSWLGPQRLLRITFQTPDFSGSFDEIDVRSPLWNITRQLTLSGGSIHVPQTASSLEEVQGTIADSAIQISGIARTDNRSGHFTVEGTVVSRELFDLSFHVEQMPTAIVDWALKMNKTLQSALGPSFDLKGRANLENQEGAFDIALSSSTAQVSTIVGTIKQGILTLQKDLSLRLSLTSEMSLALFQNKAEVTGQDPILFNLASKGFSLASPFSLDTLTIGKASLNLGRIRLRNANYLSGLSIFLKTNKMDTRLVNAWLTRADFSLKDNVLNLQRMDALLAGSIHLCMWGKANVEKQTLNMTLGVPESLLRQAFGIRSLSSQYVLQIPVTGTFQQPYIDTKAAGTKIAAIIAGGKIQERGGIVGKALGIFNQAAQEKAPPPNTTPFPWER